MPSYSRQVSTAQLICCGESWRGIPYFYNKVGEADQVAQRFKMCRKRIGSFTGGVNLCNKTAFADAGFWSWYDADAKQDGGLSWVWDEGCPDVWTAESRCACDFCQTPSNNKPLSGGIGR